MIDASKLITKTGSYQIATSSAITDKVLLEIATQYQNQISQKFTTAPAREIGKRFTGDEQLLETTKYDGEGVLVYFEAGKTPFEIFAFNAPSGRVRVGLPVLNELQKQLTAKKVKRALFRGELYQSGEINGKRVSVSEVVRISFNGSPAEVASLKLAFFDIIMLDGKDLRTVENFQTTWNSLQDLFGTDSTKSFHCAAGSIVAEKEVEKVFAAKTAAGLEGLVLRRLGRLEMTKLKPQLTVDAAIVGFVEGDFEGNYGVLSLLTALTYPEKKDGQTCYQVLARVGSGFTDTMRQELLQQLSPLKVAAPMAMTDSDGRTVHFIKPQFIAEIEGHDTVSASRLDKENETQLLSWNGREWTFVQMAACPRMIFPTLSKLRPDKEIATGGARITQILPQTTTPPVATAKTSRATNVIRRDVYKKESKGETMVRKLVIAQTEGDTNTLPYAIFWTDFSAKRKEPLKVSTAYAHTAARAEALAQQFVQEGIAKGWEKV